MNDTEPQKAEYSKDKTGRGPPNRQLVFIVIAAQCVSGPSVNLSLFFCQPLGSVRLLERSENTETHILI